MPNMRMAAFRAIYRPDDTSTSRTVRQGLQVDIRHIDNEKPNDGQRVARCDGVIIRVGQIIKAEYV